MIRWLRNRFLAGSLRRFLLLWLLGGLALVLLGATALLAGWQQQQLARAQDERLAAALDQLATTPAPAGAPDAPWHYRISAMTGERLAGDAALPPSPWRHTLAPGAAARFYVGERQGRLMRVAAAVRLRPSEGGLQPVLLQTAAPWADRLPDPAALWASGLAPLLAAAAALAGVIVSGVALATRWLAGVQRALVAPAGPATAYDGPRELQPVVERVQQFYAQQHHWVDEQRRFLADASHQLRTPMAVLRAQLQSAMAGDTPPAEVLPQMLHTVDRATGLVNQLLSLTKLEQLKRRGELKTIDVRAVALEAVLELSPLIAAKRIDFALDEDPLWAPADPTMLGELVRNLLANAIHHAPPGGRSGIVLRQGAQQRELIVWDEGPGIDDALRPRLFHPFAASQGGVGLGLSICRQIAESMGATTELYNRSAHGEVIGVDAVVAWGQGP